MGVVDEIKSRIDIVDFISSYVPLKKAGRNYKGLCPFHAEKTPSFIVFPDNQSWHCFGACGTGGDIFTFLMKRENMDFGEALRILAQRAGVELTPMTPEKEAEQAHLERLFAINDAAAQYFHELLLSSGEGERARRYLEGRGVTSESWETFQLGYGLDDWHALENHLRARGYGYEDVTELGLLIQREGGDGYFDRFRGRLMFPIRDIKSRVIGFGGRSLDGSEPKYMNSPESPLFDKGSVLYGIDRARAPIRAANQAIIVEGYMDVIMAHQYGIRNVVASMGTALTETQLRTLARLTKRMALALDSDAAGSQATLRGLETARASLEHTVTPVPLGPGLIRFETSLNVDLRIVVLPEGKDPDEVILESPDAWNRLLERATPLADYYFRVVTAELDISTAKGKSEAVERLKPVLQEIGDRVQRRHYIQQLARLLRLDERELEEIVGGGRGARRSARSSAVEQAPRPEVEPPTYEEYILYLVSQRPELVPWTDDALAEMGLEAPRLEEFGDPRSRALVQQTWQALRERAPWEQVQAGLSGELRAYLDELEERMALLPSVAEEHMRQEMLNGLLRLRQRRLQESLRELRFLCQDAEEQGDTESMKQYASAVADRTRELKAVHRAMSFKTEPGRTSHPVP
jgi:DNA primase